MQTPKLAGAVPEDTDVAYHQSDFIVIVSMKADEHDNELLLELKNRLDEIPKWLVTGKK
ncbi:MAG: hypothetical protein AB1489_07415 [Acidobacteriota bacterium]